MASYLAKKRGIPQEQAREIVNQFARDRITGRFVSNKPKVRLTSAQKQANATVNKRLGRPEDMVVYYGDLNESLGLPRHFDPQTGKVAWGDGRIDADSLHQLTRNQGKLNKNANFAETDGIEEILRGSLDTAKSADDEVRIINSFVDNEIANAQGNSLKATRAALNRELNGLIGNQGNFKSNYAAKQTLLDDPDIGPRLNALEDAMIRIDDVLSGKTNPNAANAGLYDIASEPRVQGQMKNLSDAGKRMTIEAERSRRPVINEPDVNYVLSRAGASPEEIASGKITVYRATENGKILPGDFVTPNKDVIKPYFDQRVETGRKPEIISQKVAIKDLVIGDEITDFVYRPRDIMQQSGRPSAGSAVATASNTPTGTGAVTPDNPLNPRVAQPTIDGAISSDAIKTKQGKIKLDQMPTQTEIKNRAEINAGNPDLYDQRTVKLEKAFNQKGTGVGEGIPELQARIANTLPSPSDTSVGLPSAKLVNSRNTSLRSSGGSVPPKPKTVKITGVDKPGVMTKVRETVQDDWIRVKNLQRQKGVTVGKDSNPYLKEELYHGRVGARLEDVKNTVSEIDKDIVATAKSLGTDDRKLIERVNQYLHAKHTPERNKRLGDGASGMTNEQANAVLKEISQSSQGKEIVRLADKVKQLNTKTLDILLEGEVIDKELYTTLKTTYKDHVPLNRIMDETDDIAQVLAGKGFNVKSTGIKRAKGSEREVSDIMTNVVANVEQAIVRAERNRVNKATLNFARNNPQLGVFEEIKPKVIGKDFRDNPIFERITDPLVLHVRENGKPVYLRIKDKNLATVFQGVGQEKLPGLFNFVGAITRFYSGLHTRFTPEFAASNIVRDTQELAVYMASQDKVGISGAGRTVMRDPSSAKAIIDSMRGVNSDGAKLYKQMQMDGGTTGGMALSTRDKVELDLAKIRSLNRSNPKAAAEKVLQSFDAWNTVFEDASRLSAYKQALASGYSREQAASIAKNSTVNFNKKGTGGPIINSLYMFSNASIQGSVKMLRAMRNPKVAATVVTAVGGSTFAINSWNDTLDPEWRDKVTEWDRNSNQVIVLPTTEGISYFTIPVSWGIKPIKVASDMAYDLMTGRAENVGDAALKIAKSTIDAYNPAGGTDAISIAAPTILDLPIDLARNKSWSGAKIKPDWMQGLPQAEQHFSSTGDSLTGKVAVGVTNALSKGTNRVIDISPDNLLYAYENLIGGTGRFISRGVNTAVAGVQGELPPAKDIPFVNRFYKTRTEEQISQGLSRKSESEFMDTLRTLETGSEAQKEEMKAYLRTLESDDQRKKVLYKIREAGFPTKGVSYSSAKLGKGTGEYNTSTKRVFEESEEAPKNLMERVHLAAQGVTKDPKNVIKAIFTEERLRKIEGDAVILEREQYLNNLNDENLHVDHIIPLGLGGDNSDGNLQVLERDVKGKKDKLEKQLIRQLQNGEITRKEAQEQIRAYNEANPPGVPYERMSIQKQSSLRSKANELKEETKDEVTAEDRTSYKKEITKQLSTVKTTYKNGDMTREEARDEALKLVKAKAEYEEPKTEGKESNSVNALIDKHFPPEARETARAVMLAESGGRQDAVGDEYEINGLYAPSYGLFQIRALEGRPNPEVLLDPEENVKFAAQLYKQQGWQPWSAYTNGNYQQYLGDAGEQSFLDEELRQDRMADVRSQKNDITDLFTAGILTREEANKELAALDTIHESLKKSGKGGSKSKRAITIAQSKAPTVRFAGFKRRSLPTPKLQSVRSVVKKPSSQRRYTITA